MQRREQGWILDGTRPDMWEAVDTAQGLCFTNRVSDTHQSDEPTAFYGGIIADPMGFGKTLAMISLIASDSQYLALYETSDLSRVLREESCGLTLVIVPPALLGTWEEELSSHTEHMRLPYVLHYGKSRPTDISQLANTAIVLTTYDTVSAEWRLGRNRESTNLFTVRWRRLVLDEAHIIRNSESQKARAVCALDSVSRWAVTGTPIQNHLNDLAALLKFLSVYPYSDKRTFDADVSNLWNSGRAEEAVKRLKRLAGCLLLRRPKKTIQLPTRQDLACYVEFQPDERELYNQVRNQTIARLDEALLESRQGTRPGSYITVLQQIEAMRMVCNLGLLFPSRHDASLMTGKKPNVETWEHIAQGAFNLRLEIGSIECIVCSFSLDATNNSLNDNETARALFTRCLGLICPSCVQRSSHGGAMQPILRCSHERPCPIAPVTTSPASLEALPVPLSLGSFATATYLPTKVKSLVTDLKMQPTDVKIVVFSTWRTTLDVVEAGLNQAGIPALRFDGKVPQRERQSVVDQFRHDPNVRVLLLTLSCGAVGLTLTAATRAYLMEPHWNPTLEDQALARIHRLGQEKEVKTLRFYVRDSFEESVVKNQNLKRELAGILLAPGGVANTQLEHLEVSILVVDCYHAGIPDFHATASARSNLGSRRFSSSDGVIGWLPGSKSRLICWEGLFLVQVVICFFGLLRFLFVFVVRISFFKIVQLLPLYLLPKKLLKNNYFTPLG
ncbi:WD domain-containing protein [Colletotrichum plurivorum]|uniref:WD domain-containing protein n=1 Tax=Colletotrichum plurivorum TaxID=2175906 RepID=A0A8H6K5P5_9PEZI|nr:WD domain-containing protein [Colletotrichum plurivorum]